MLRTASRHQPSRLDEPALRAASLALPSEIAEQFPELSRPLNAVRPGHHLRPWHYVALAFVMVICSVAFATTAQARARALSGPMAVLSGPMAVLSGPMAVLSVALELSASLDLPVAFDSSLSDRASQFVELPGVDGSARWQDGSTGSDVDLTVSEAEAGEGKVQTNALAAEGFPLTLVPRSPRSAQVSPVVRVVDKSQFLVGVALPRGPPTAS